MPADDDDVAHIVEPAHGLDTHHGLAARVRALRPDAADGHAPPSPLQFDPEVFEEQRARVGVPLGVLTALPPRAIGEMPAIRTLDGDGRVRAEALVVACGWPAAPTALVVRADRDTGWAWLTPCDAPVRRATAKLDKHGRIGLPAGLRAWLGVDAHDDVVLRADPAAGRIAVAHPGLLLRALDALDLLERMRADGVPAPSPATNDTSGEVRA